MKINKTHVRQAILDGEVGEAIKMLLALLEHNDSSAYNGVILQSSRYSSLQRQMRGGTISEDIVNMRSAQVVSSITYYLDKVKDEWEVDWEQEVNRSSPTPSPSPPTPRQKTILCLSSNPLDSDRLATDIEVREIKLSLEMGKDREDFKLVYESAVSIQDFRKAVMIHEPTVIHFSGHGTAEGEIILHSRTDREQKVDAVALGNFFEIMAEVGKPIECVVLNACYSELQAKEIARSVPIVVGMNSAVADRTAIAFAQSFYQVLANGRDYEIAFRLAHNNIEMEGLSGVDLPVFVKQSAD